MSSTLRDSTQSWGPTRTSITLPRPFAANNMGLLLDIVPNHMSASVDNHWWRDVLMNGRASRYADFFDVDWESEGGKIVLPILGHSLDQAIAEGGVSYDGDSLQFRQAKRAARWFRWSA